MGASVGTKASARGVRRESGRPAELRAVARLLGIAPVRSPRRARRRDPQVDRAVQERVRCTMNLGRTGHLTYCTNIRPGESWPAVQHNLESHLFAVRRQFEPSRSVRHWPSPLGDGHAYRVTSSCTRGICRRLEVQGKPLGLRDLRSTPLVSGWWSRLQQLC